MTDIANGEKMATQNNDDLISKRAALERIESLDRKFTGHVVSVNDVFKAISNLPAYPKTTIDHSDQQRQEQEPVATGLVDELKADYNKLRAALEEAKDFIQYLNQTGLLTGKNKLKKFVVSLMEKAYLLSEQALASTQPQFIPAHDEDDLSNLHGTDWQMNVCGTDIFTFKRKQNDNTN